MPEAAILDPPYINFRIRFRRQGTNGASPGPRAFLMMTGEGDGKRFLVPGLAPYYANLTEPDIGRMKTVIVRSVMNLHASQFAGFEIEGADLVVTPSTRLCRDANTHMSIGELASGRLVEARQRAQANGLRHSVMGILQKQERIRAHVKECTIARWSLESYGQKCVMSSLAMTNIFTQSVIREIALGVGR